MLLKLFSYAYKGQFIVVHTYTKICILNIIEEYVEYENSVVILQKKWICVFVLWCTLLASATRRAETEGLGETTLKKIKK